MLKLNNNPFYNDTITLNLSFVDAFGNKYIPAELSYSFLAQASNKKDWLIVNSLQNKNLAPASSVLLQIPSSLNTPIEGTNNQRRILVRWSALLNNQLTYFTDEVLFEEQSYPDVVNPVPPPTDPEYGSVSTDPVYGYLEIRFTRPVTAFNLTVAGIERTTAPADSSLTVYHMSLQGFEIGEYSYEIDHVHALEPLVVFEDSTGSFIITSGDIPPEVIQGEKVVSITENGEHIITPDEGYPAVAKVTAVVDVPPNLEEKTVSVTTNGEVELLPEEADGFSKVNLEVDVPQPTVEANKIVEITNNGETVIEPTTGFDVIEKVTANVSIPVPVIESEKTVTIDVATYEQPVEVEPSQGKDGIAAIEIILTGIPQIQEEKTVKYTANGEFEVFPDSAFDGVAKTIVNVAVPSDIKPEQDKELNIVSNGTVQVFPDEGYALNCVNINVNVNPPLEEANTVIDVGAYTGPINVIPTTPNYGLSQDTISITNIPSSGGPSEYYAWYAQNIAEANQFRANRIVYLNTANALEFADIVNECVILNPRTAPGVQVQNFASYFGVSSDTIVKISAQNNLFSVGYSNGGSLIPTTFTLLAANSAQLLQPNNNFELNLDASSSITTVWMNNADAITKMNINLDFTNILNTSF